MSISLDEFEDYLQDNNVFENGITGRRCFMDSYMTILNYENLQKALKTSPFTLEQTIEVINKMDKFDLPMNKLTVKAIKRFYNI
jgi:hypothetical protein